MNERGPNGATPLHVAASVDVARLLIEAGADLGAKDDSGNTPERFAAWFPSRRDANLEVVEILLDHGADLDAVDDQHGGTPLDWAEFHGRAEIARSLRTRGAKGAA